MPVSSSKKTAIANLRMTPQSKAGLRAIAEREGRSMANSIEWLIADYFRTRKIPMPEHQPRTRAPKAAKKGQQ